MYYYRIWRYRKMETKETQTKKYNNMKEFWPFYLSEHSHPTNRLFHYIGSSLGLVCLALTIYTMNPWFIPLGFVCGYAFAWIGHFFIEKNRPATFTYPFKSFASDWIMYFYMLTGQIQKQLEKHNIQKKPTN